MPSGFQDFQFHIADQLDGPRGIDARPSALRGVRRSATAPETAPNQEAAARLYLGALLGDERQPTTVRSLAAPERPEAVPDLRLRDIQPLKDTSLVRFVQTKRTIPIFGSRAIVELDGNNELVSAETSLAEIPNITPFPALDETQAFGRIVEKTGVTPDTLAKLDPPEKTFFHDDEKDTWHLAWYFKNVPAAPEGFTQGLKSHGVGQSPTQVHPELDYLVDAHNGEILLYWSSAPTAAPDAPVWCVGDDEFSKRQKFFGRAVKEGGPFELFDPMKGIKTYDFAGQTIENGELPANPITVKGPTAEFLGMAGAVSAHYHAKLVDDFLRKVLARNGIDNKGMELISCVNCTSLYTGPGPEWKNAAWWRKRMWYGQVTEKGKLRSYSRYLDVIAHELAHGVTESTANLVYLNESGALNESFSDIFGVIIKNWDWSKETGGEVGNWDWEIGAGLGDNGLPLRDMKDPARTGDPDHWSKYKKTTADSGGVHTNSNIHNKAAYNVLTVKNADGTWMFTPQDVAILYYYCLLRLDRMATFKQARTALLNVAKTLFSGSAEGPNKVAAIAKAYDDVGIA